MLKKTITYKDLNGKEITEDFYFHMTKADLAEMEVTFPGGLRNHLMSISAAQDKGQIARAFKTLIAAAVGKRVDDVQFVKDEKITAAFMNSDAYSELVISFFKDTGAAIEFITGIMPADLVSKVDMAAIAAKAEELGDVSYSLTEAPELLSKSDIEEFTEQELMDMPSDQFGRLLAGIKGKNVPKDILMIAMRRASQ